MSFRLHPTLEQDTHTVAELPLCRLLLMKDGNYPWFVLVPARDGLREAYELSEVEQQQLAREVNGLAAFLQRELGADKMNVAALGNVVPQLHVHVIARFHADPAWPAPVWGRLPAQPLSTAQQAQWLDLGRRFALGVAGRQ